MGTSAGIRGVFRILWGGALVVLSLSVQSGSAVTPGSKAAGLDACVAPTPEMRRNHMDFLKHDRSLTVHQGIRDIKNSLAGCVDCHAAQDGGGGFKPVNDTDQFCSGCHAFMAVDLTCFQCHRNTPGEGDATTASTGPGSVETIQPLESLFESPTDTLHSDTTLSQHQIDSRRED
ncbi:MAG: sulfur reduction protein DsrJ [Gammaproteobacteria bacterium]|nr:sulfur reduction protein DsrJ [Gammaproteobacteria bacterium]